LRLPTSDPNCYERTAIYLAVAERVDPYPLRRPVTVPTPSGPHTLVVEDGEPVVLDPSVDVRGAFAALRDGTTSSPSGRRVRSAPLRTDAPPDGEPEALLGWVAWIAEETAIDQCGEAGARRVERVRRIFDRLLRGEPAARFRSAETRAEIAWLLDVADHAANLWGADGIMGVHLARSALAMLDLLPPRSCSSPVQTTEVPTATPPRNLRIHLPRAIRDVLETGARIGRDVAVTAARQYAMQMLGLSAFVPPTVGAPTTSTATAPTAGSAGPMPVFSLQVFTPATTRR
jgi:hypothetical protein